MTTFLPFRADVTTINAWRNPTQSEIKRGYGAIHHKEFSVDLWKKPNGQPKKWIVCPIDDLRYYR